MENTQRILDELIEYVQDMREIGENDLRSVLNILIKYQSDENYTTDQDE